MRTSTTDGFATDDTGVHCLCQQWLQATCDKTLVSEVWEEKDEAAEGIGDMSWVWTAPSTGTPK
eukprot:7639162-Prorocentrum_lima.AAC.1